ncbi:MAG: HAD hydrolase family protein [Negativibacillus sp.]
MGKRIYCSDVDGTLARQGYFLTEDTCRLVHQLVEQDVWFTIITGRFLSRTLPLIQELGLKIPASCLSGALVYDCAGERILKVWPIPQETAYEVLRRFQSLKHNSLAVIYRPEENRCLLCYNKSGSQPFPMDKRNEKGFLHDEVVESQDLLPLLEGGQALLLDMAGDEERMKKAYELVKDLPGIHAYLHESPHNKGFWVLDVVAADSGKGNAVRYLKEYMQSDTSVAFGDHYNDLPMLQAADIACTVAEAPEELKAAADVVLPQTPNCVPEFILEQEKRS